MDRLVGIPGAPATIAEPLRRRTNRAGRSATTHDHHRHRRAIARRDARSGASVLVTPEPRVRRRPICCTAGGGPRSTFATTRSCAPCGWTALPRGRFRVRCSTPSPKRPPIAAPNIAEAGSPGPLATLGFPVGAVVRVTRTQATEYYVVLADGVQRIGEVAADLIRFSDSQHRREIVTVAPDDIGRCRLVHDLPVASFPDHGGVGAGAVVCAQWAATHGGDVKTALLVGDSLPVSGGTPVGLVQADGTGPERGQRRHAARPKRLRPSVGRHRPGREHRGVVPRHRLRGGVRRARR